MLILMAIQESCRIWTECAGGNADGSPGKHFDSRFSASPVARDVYVITLSPAVAQGGLQLPQQREMVGVESAAWRRARDFPDGIDARLWYPSHSIAAS
jgi:hypothetical protein